MDRELTYTIGCDPELFLQDKGGHFRSAHNILPGTKEMPFVVEKGGVQVDGTAAEFNIFPAFTPQEFSENIQSVLKSLQQIVESKNKNYHLIVQPTASYDPKYFKSIPKRAKLLGCDPDFNAYTSGANPKPDNRKPFRTGGGHIHLGWTQGATITDGSHEFDCRAMTKQLDAVLYPMSLLWDDDQKRREMYGKIGTYRPKEYGVEYRPLSNAWVADPDLHVWIFKATKYAARMLDEDNEMLERDAFWIGLKNDIDAGKVPSKAVLREYHDYLYEEFNMPMLPQLYV